MKKLLFLVFMLVLASCEKDRCRSYSDFTCEEIEQANYNVYFYFPDQQEEYLGQTTGLSSCGSIAHSFASDKNLYGNSEWGYICCMITSESQCYEKHR